MPTPEQFALGYRLMVRRDPVLSKQNYQRAKSLYDKRVSGIKKGQSFQPIVFPYSFYKSHSKTEIPYLQYLFIKRVFSPPGSKFLPVYDNSGVVSSDGLSELLKEVGSAYTSGKKNIKLNLIPAQVGSTNMPPKNSLEHLLGEAYHFDTSVILDYLKSSIKGCFCFEKRKRQVFYDLNSKSEVINPTIKPWLIRLETDNNEDLLIELPNLCLLPSIKYVGVHSFHPSFHKLVGSKVKNPSTGKYMKLVSLAAEDNSVDNEFHVKAIIPGHILNDSLVSEKLENSSGLGPVVKIDGFYENAGIFDGTHASEFPSLLKEITQKKLIMQEGSPLVPFILEKECLLNKDTGELIEITEIHEASEKFQSWVTEVIFSLPQFRRLISAPNRKFWHQQKTPIVVPSSFTSNVKVLLAAFNIHNKICELSTFYDYDMRNVSKLDWNKLESGFQLRIDDCFKTNNFRRRDKNLNTDLLNGLLLSPTNANEVHVTTYNIRNESSVISVLFHNVQHFTKHVKEFKFGFLPFVLNREHIDNISDWSYYIVHETLNLYNKQLMNYLKLDYRGMKNDAEDLLLLLNNIYAEIYDAEEQIFHKTSNLSIQEQKTIQVSKDILGTILMYSIYLLRPFYPVACDDFYFNMKKTLKGHEEQKLGDFKIFEVLYHNKFERGKLLANLILELTKIQDQISLHTDVSFDRKNLLIIEINEILKNHEFKVIHRIMKKSIPIKICSMGHLPKHQIVSKTITRPHFRIHFVNYINYNETKVKNKKDLLSKLEIR